MSIRTLVEINHDHLHKIESNPEEFVKWLVAAALEGGTCEQRNTDDGYCGETHMQLWMAGGAVKHQRHHSSPCPTGVDS